MTWLQDHLGDVLGLAVRHIYLAGVPLILGCSSPYRSAGWRGDTGGSAQF